MLTHKPLRAILVGAVVALASTSLDAAPVNLNTWTAESYPSVSGFGAGVWTVASGGGSVHQSVNGQPTLFYSDFNATGSDVQGKIKVQDAGDDDYVGFALGFSPGDTGNSAANYLLLDWKKATQNFDFGSPSTTPGSTAFIGLAVSRVTGVPTADEFWGHVNFPSHAGGSVQELARGATLGSAGWLTNTEYTFRMIFTSTNLKVYVDDILQMDVNGTFQDGRLAFYNFSQANVTYSAFTIDPAPGLPAPGGVALFAAGLISLVLLKRRILAG